MIITCPDCETRYKTSAKAIGPNGRAVRCAACNSSWFVPAEEGDLTLDRLALEDIEAGQHEVFKQEKKIRHTTSEKLSEQSKRYSSVGPGRTVDEDALVAAAWAGKTEEGPSFRGAHAVMRERAERQKSRRRLWNVMLIWLIPLLLIGGSALAAYYFRQDVVNRAPKSASLYKVFGIDVSAPGLALAPPTTRYAQIDGKPALVIEGAVRNISNETLSLPLVALSLHNSSGQQLAEWNVELETPRLDAGDSAPYISQYPAPPLDAVELRSRFVNETNILSTPVDVFTPDPN